MRRTKHQISDVIYNAAEQAFEAIVTFHTSDGRMSYATSHKAPLTTSYSDAAAALVRDAHRQVREGAEMVGVFRPKFRKPRVEEAVWQPLQRAA